MLLKFVLFAFLVCNIPKIINGYRSYEGYKVLRVQTQNKEQVEAIAKLEDVYDFWHDPYLEGHADIMSSNLQLETLQNFLNSNKFNFSIMVEDVEGLINAERASNNGLDGRMNWQSYQRLDTIYEWIFEQRDKYPDMITIYNAGSSYEERPIYVMKISAPSNVNSKLAIWMDSTIHAREWISTSTITYIINEILTNQSNHSKLLENCDLYFLVVVNPDGYEYTHLEDRMHRKTMQIHDPNGICIGTDANRNFDFQFGGQGSSGDPCSNSYRGPEPWSEKEAFTVQNAIRFFEESNEANWIAFFTIHSYGQLWLTPWGYTHDFPEDYDELKFVGDLATEALKTVHGTVYRVGTSANILYPSSGTSRDWAKGEGKIKYSYTIELRDTGDFGFVLPANQILPVGEETMLAIQTALDYIIDNN